MKSLPIPHRLALAALGLLLAAGCMPPGGNQDENISERGGFPDPEMRLAPEAEGDYCAAEILRWRFDEATETLRLGDARVLLGCCGQRSARVERVDSLIELTQLDEPDLGAGRCDGRCAYDVAVSVPLPGHGGPGQGGHGSIVLRVLRDVTDAQGGPTLVWQGSIDLTQPSGQIVLDSSHAGANCRDPGP
jgi:hypothetical protein